MPLRHAGGLVVVVALAACNAAIPSPVASPSPSLGSTPSASPMHGTPTIQAMPELTKFSANGIAFEYPSHWRLIADEVFNGVDLSWVVGTGDWDDGCSSSGAGTSCTGSTLLVDPGEVAMEFSVQIHGPYVPVFEAPPFDSTILPSGVVADLQGVDSAIGALVYAPDRQLLRVRASHGSPASESDRALIRRVIDSIEYGGGDPGISGDSWNPSSIGAGECVRQTVEGRLNRGHSPVLNLLGPDLGFTILSWPRGWFSRNGDDARMEVVDDSGDAVATQWDGVAIGGRGDSNEFRVCPDAVSVIRAFPRR